MGYEDARNVIFTDKHVVVYPSGGTLEQARTYALPTGLYPLVGFRYVFPNRNVTVLYPRFSSPMFIANEKWYYHVAVGATSLNGYEVSVMDNAIGSVVVFKPISHVDFPPDLLFLKNGNIAVGIRVGRRLDGAHVYRELLLPDSITSQYSSLIPLSGWSRVEIVYDRPIPYIAIIYFDADSSNLVYVNCNYFGCVAYATNVDDDKDVTLIVNEVTNFVSEHFPKMVTFKQNGVLKTLVVSSIEQSSPVTIVQPPIFYLPYSNNINLYVTTGGVLFNKPGLSAIATVHGNHSMMHVSKVNVSSNTNTVTVELVKYRTTQVSVDTAPCDVTFQETELNPVLVTKRAKLSDNVVATVTEHEMKLPTTQEDHGLEIVRTDVPLECRSGVPSGPVFDFAQFGFYEFDVVNGVGRFVPPGGGGSVSLTMQVTDIVVS